jgi:hypothetical protein
VVPPVPFPNTEVKRLSADDTESEGSCGKYVIARRLLFYLFSGVFGNKFAVKGKLNALFL